MCFVQNGGTKMEPGIKVQDSKACQIRLSNKTHLFPFALKTDMKVNSGFPAPASIVWWLSECHVYTVPSCLYSAEKAPWEVPHIYLLVPTHKPATNKLSKHFGKCFSFHFALILWSTLKSWPLTGQVKCQSTKAQARASFIVL